MAQIVVQLMKKKKINYNYFYIFTTYKFPNIIYFSFFIKKNTGNYQFLILKSTNSLYSKFKNKLFIMF